MAQRNKAENVLLRSQIVNKFEEQLKFRYFIYDQVKLPAIPLTLDNICASFFKKFKLHLNKQELKRFFKIRLRIIIQDGKFCIQKITKMDNIIINRKIFYALYLKIS